MSVVLKFRRPNTLTMLSLLWNEFLARFQGRVHYTSDQAPKINLTAFQRWLQPDQELIWWESWARKRLTCRKYTDFLQMILSGSYRSRVERRTKYSWKRSRIRPQGVENRVVIENQWAFFKPMDLFVFNSWFWFVRGWIEMRLKQIADPQKLMDSPAKLVLPDSRHAHCLLSEADQTLRLQL